MSETTSTPFSSKCEILAELWVTYKNESDFEDFIDYNDLGLPLAYALAYGIVEPTELSEKFINETFDVLLAIYGLEDTGFESLNDIVNLANDNLNLKADSEE
jgi:hypothetical protein